MIIVDEVRIASGHFSKANNTQMPRSTLMTKEFCLISFLLRECFVSYPNLSFLVQQDATLELRVRTVKYFKDMWQVFASLTS